MNYVATIETRSSNFRRFEIVRHRDLQLVGGNRLVRWLWQLLGKLKPTFDRSVMEKHFYTVPICGDTIIQQLGASKHELQRIWTKEATTLVIGRSAARGLWRDMEDRCCYINTVMSVTLGNQEETRVLGLRFVVVPWMEGWVLLPDLTEKKSAGLV